jgi:hypothetical protein
MLQRQYDFAFVLHDTRRCVNSVQLRSTITLVTDGRLRPPGPAGAPLCAAREGCMKCTAVFADVRGIQCLRDVHGMCAISQSLENACVMYENIGPADGHNSMLVAERAQTPELHCVREPALRLSQQQAVFRIC